MANSGFTKEKAQMIERRYHELYVVSDQWVSSKLDQASKDGYVTVAFGLRVRTPLLKQVIRKTSKTPYEAEAEGRSAGNALGQSWCMLNSRASIEFMGNVRKSPHRLNIRPCAQIHDAQYYLVKDDIEALMYANKYLVKAVKWQEHPDIAHDEVKLSGKLGIFYPDWTNEITLPNDATADEIMQAINEGLDDLKKKNP
jgi:DNA polymerase-1